MRVTPSLDTINSFEICNPPVDSFIQSDPAVVFAGTNYLVAWSDEKYGPSNYYHPFVARVTPAGVVLDSGVRVSTAGVAEYRPNLADDGTRSLVVWSGSSAGCYGRFVNRDGMPEGNIITLATGTASGPNLEFGDTCFLAAWHAGAYPSLELYGSLVSRQGDLIGSTIPIATGGGCHRWADVAFDGTSFLVVWMSGVNSQPETIFGRFIGQDGVPVGPRFAVSGTSPVVRWWPSVAFSDSNCLVAWEQGPSYDVYGNVDVLVTGIAEESPPAPDFGPAKPVGTYDASGRRSAGLKPGVYFVRLPGRTAKVLRVR